MTRDFLLVSSVERGRACPAGWSRRASLGGLAAVLARSPRHGRGRAPTMGWWGRSLAARPTASPGPTRTARAVGDATAAVWAAADDLRLLRRFARRGGRRSVGR